jgi:precorrin-6A synthase
VKEHRYRIVEAASPERRRDTADYVSAVEELNRDKQLVFERLIAEELSDGECGAFLVWGDPHCTTARCGSSGQLHAAAGMSSSTT